jgi:hypothetical protein
MTMLVRRGEDGMKFAGRSLLGTGSALAEAKARPGPISMGHAVNGTSNEVDILRLQVSERVQYNNIPVTGSGLRSQQADGEQPPPCRPALDLAAAHQEWQAGDQPRAVAGPTGRAVLPGHRRHTVRRRHHSRLDDLGAITRPTTPEQYAEMLKSDEANVVPLVQSGLLKPE